MMLPKIFSAFDTSWISLNEYSSLVFYDDLVITTTDDETINKTAVTDPLISDHSAITLTLNIQGHLVQRKLLLFEVLRN